MGLTRIHFDDAESVDDYEEMEEAVQKKEAPGPIRRQPLRRPPKSSKKEVFFLGDDAYAETCAPPAPPPLSEEQERQMRKRSCWHAFTHCVTGMWSTREMTRSKNKQVIARATIRELVVYTVFIVMLCVVTFGQSSPTMFYWTQNLLSLFTTGSFAAISDQTSFFTYLESDFLNGLYFAENNTDQLGDNQFLCPGGTSADGPCPGPANDKNILYENRLLGLPRIRQLRVYNGSCSIPVQIQRFMRECYADYSPEFEDTAAFGINDTILERNFTQESAWTYQTEAELNGVSISTDYMTYSGAGSVQILSSNQDITLAIFQELREGLWLGRGTRFVAIDFTVYNANINLFCIMTIIFEFPAIGGVMATTQFHTVKLLSYVNPTDFFLLSCQIAYCCFIVYFIIEEILEFQKKGPAYLRNGWNILDLVVIAISIAAIVITIFFQLEGSNQLATLLNSPDDFANFTVLSAWSNSMDTIMAMCILISWLKFLKYISFNRTMIQLSETAIKASAEMGCFLIMFAIAFLAFVVGGNFIFGNTMQSYSSFTDSTFTLLRLILGDFDFLSMQAADAFFGPLFFIGYTFYVFFVLLSMFLAIINDTYIEVKEEIAARLTTYEIDDYFKRGYQNILDKFSTDRKVMDMFEALRAAGVYGDLSYDELRVALKKSNFSECEINLFFDKYNSDNDNTISALEANQLYEDLGMEVDDEMDAYGGVRRSAYRARSGREARQMRSARIYRNAYAERMGIPGHLVVTEGDVKILAVRINHMERSISRMVAKLDAAVNRLMAMEEIKEKKREAMDDFFTGAGARRRSDAGQ